MGTVMLEFADELFSFLALKYEIVPTDEEAPPVEEYDWQSKLFSVNITRAVMMLSYTYRSAFKKHFKSVSTLICSSKETAKLYPFIFATVTYQRYSPLKILVLCSFISEMYLHIYFQAGSSKDVRGLYTIPSTRCLVNIYNSVLCNIFDPIPRWNDVKYAATLISKGYSVLEPIMKTEHPSESKFFFRSVQDVLSAQEKTREPEDSPEIFWDEATNKPPSKSRNKEPLSNTKSKYLAASERLMSKTATNVMTRQSIPQTSSTNASKNDGSIDDDQSKPRGKKLSSKTKAASKPSAPGSQAMASGIDETKNRSSAISFGTLDQINPKIPGLGDLQYTSFETDYPKEKDGSSKASNPESKAKPKSSRPNPKSKKHKKKK